MELMVQIGDAPLADWVRTVIDAQRAQSTPITPQLHATRATLLNRLRWAAAWFVVGIVDYGVTRRLNFGLPPAK
jgi:cardiolipin synthase